MGAELVELGLAVVDGLDLSIVVAVGALLVEHDQAEVTGLVLSVALISHGKRNVYANLNLPCRFNCKLH